LTKGPRNALERLTIAEMKNVKRIKSAIFLFSIAVSGLAD
jgi:hypothetical protein